MRNKATAAAVAVCVGLIGCGGGSESSSTSSGAAPLTKAEFVAKANAICRNTNRALDQTARKQFGGDGPSAAEAQAFLKEQVIPAIQAEVVAIRKLQPPDGDEQTVNQLLDAVASGAQKAKADPNSLQASGKADPLYQGIQLAKAYGLSVCAAQ